MGDGAFGSNGSVHWTVRYKGKAGFKVYGGRDLTNRHPGDRRKGLPVALMQRRPIGRGQGAFLVTARFTGKREAVAALNRARKSYKNGKITLPVALRPFRSNPGKSNAWEVKVRW
jgi:hypothetical protein